MRPFLILQLRPETEVADDEFRAILEHGQLDPDEVVRVRVNSEGVPDADPREFAGIIVGGSPFEVTTPEQEKSETQRGIEAGFGPLLDRVVELDTPFLGCCSGHGLLGRHCDTPMSSQYRETVGPAEVLLAETGRNDPLLQGFPDSFRVFLGHKEALDDLPEGAVLLVRGRHCPIQMFRLGEHVYSTQFHPEGDPRGFALRIRYYRDHGYFPAEKAELRLSAVEGVDTPWAHALLQRFVARYRDPS